MAGELDEQSQAIGQLQAGLEALRLDHAEKSREDREFRRAGYKAFENIERIAKTQEDHATELKAHGERLDKVDQRHSRQKGVMVALGAVGSAIMGFGALVVQYLTSPPQ